MLTKIGSNFNRKAWVIIAIAILIDWLFSLIGATTGLVITSFIGLFLVSALCGPWAGALTGMIGTLITSIFWFLFFPETRDYYTVNSLLGWFFFYMFIGYFAGGMAQWGYFKFWWTSILVGFITAISAITLLLVSSLIGAEMSDFSSIFSFTFILSMTISALIVFFLVRSPLNKFFAGLPHTDYVQIENNINDGQLNSDEKSLKKEGATTAQKAIGLAILVVVIFSITFVIWFAMGISGAVN